jgi:hypothetical protein
VRHGLGPSFPFSDLIRIAKAKSAEEADAGRKGEA